MKQNFDLIGYRVKKFLHIYKCGTQSFSRHNRKGNKIQNYYNGSLDSPGPKDRYPSMIK